jgi:hypothetical protein
VAALLILSGRVRVAALLVAISAAGMVMVRHWLRLVRLEDRFDPGSLPVQPEWSPFILFVACLLLALALAWYMLRVYFRNATTPQI